MHLRLDLDCRGEACPCNSREACWRSLASATRSGEPTALCTLDPVRWLTNLTAQIHAASRGTYI